MYACMNDKSYHIVKWLLYLDNNFITNTNNNNKTGLMISLMYNNKNILYSIIKKKKVIRDTCSICYTNSTTLITDCNHQYCYECLKEWIKHNNKCKCNCCCIVDNITCPLCRHAISTVYSI